MQDIEQHEFQTTARARRFFLVLVLGCLTAIAPLSIDMYLPALPSLSVSLHASTSVTQLSLTACLIGLAVGQLVAGPISDARGRRMPLLVGVAVYTVASALCAITPSVWILILFRLIQGLAGSAGLVIARAIVRDMYSGTLMTKFFALLMLVNGVAPIAAPIIGGQLLRFTSWHGIFIILGIVGLLMFLGVFFGVPETLPQTRRHVGGIKATGVAMKKLIQDRVFIGYSGAMGLVFAAMFSYISGSPFILQNVFGVSPQMFSVIFAVNGVGIILAGQIGAALSARYGERILFISGLALAGMGGVVLLGMLLSGAGLIGVLPPLFCVVSSVGIVSATGTSLAMQGQGTNAGSAAALIGVPQMLVGAIAAPLVGVGGSHTAVPMGLMITICALGAILCYWVLIRGSRSLE